MNMTGIRQTAILYFRGQDSPDWNLEYWFQKIFRNCDFWTFWNIDSKFRSRNKSVPSIRLRVFQNRISHTSDKMFHTSQGKPLLPSSAQAQAQAQLGAEIALFSQLWGTTIHPTPYTIHPTPGIVDLPVSSLSITTVGTCSWLINNFFTTCLWLAYNLFTTSS